LCLYSRARLSSVLIVDWSNDDTIWLHVFIRVRLSCTSDIGLAVTIALSASVHGGNRRSYIHLAVTIALGYL